MSANNIMQAGKITYDDKGRIKNWFSNMLPLDEPFEYQGVLYRTSENFCRHEKRLLLYPLSNRK